MLGVLVGVGVASHILRLQTRTEYASEYTVVVFAAVVSMLRPHWHKGKFWSLLALLFSVHLLLVALILLRMPPEGEWIHGVPMILAAIAEAFVVGGIAGRILNH